MSNFISLELDTFTGRVNALKAEANSLATNNSYKVEITGSSEVMQSYVECMEEIRALLSTYRAFLNEDIERIRSAGNAMIQAEKELVR